MRFPIRKRQQPCAHDVDSVEPLAKNTSPEMLAIFGPENAIGVVWKSREHRDLMAGVGPVARKF
jgi:bifunctional pyridoxal-dependent enzyme with beta-cystathionase and maltose regulon repressor activities